MASSSEKSNLLGKRNLEDDLETKQIILKKHKENSEEKETTKEVADTLQQIELLDTKSDQDNLISVKGATKRKRTLYVGNLSCDSEISDIIDFFKDVGEVVHVRIVVNDKGTHKGYSYVKFASSSQAKMALINKNGEYLHDHKIRLDVAKREEFFSRPKYCINHKVWYKDDYLGPEEDETVDGLDEAYFVEDAVIRKKTLFVANLSPETKISDIIDFFENVGEVVRVQLGVNMISQPRGCGLVEFASINEAKKALEKNGEFLDDSKIFLFVAKIDQTIKYCIDHKVWYEDYLGRESLLTEEDEAVEGLDETPDYVEDVLFVANLSSQTKILNVINFFNDVVGVVSVRLIANHEGRHVGCGFVEFASSYEAKKALKEKNGEYLLDHQIFLDVAKSAPYLPGPKHNLAEMLCYDDLLRRESLVMKDDETSNCVEAVSIRKKTLFVNHLSCHTGISHIIDFFKDVGEVVHVRLIVNDLGKHESYGFVEFASANEAKKALKKKNGEYLQDCKILLDVARTDPNLPPPKYCIDHKVWYEDYLRQENLLIEEDEAVEGLDVTPDYVKEVAIRKKTLFVANISGVATMCNIINFFKDVGKVRVRLIVDHMTKHVGCAFVEFASANEAKKALRIKNGEILCGRQVFLSVVKMAPYPIRPKYKLAEMLWCKDNLGEDEEEEDEDLEIKQDVKKQTVFCGKKITFSDDDDEDD